MNLGLVGLGRMGANITERLQRGGHSVTVFDINPAAVQQATAVGARGVDGLPSLVAALTPPRVIWLMLPAGAVTQEAMRTLASHMQAEDILIDGGNSNYQHTLAAGVELAERGIHLVDVGTSGGIWGKTEGYSMMVGGSALAVATLTPIFRTLAPAPDLGWGHVGSSGSGHFVKMVHNGIEYGMMQALAEGFDILAAKQEFKLDLAQIGQIWRHGSVVRSWLLDLLAQGLHENPRAAGLSAYVEDSGEGRWTVDEAIRLNVPAPVITHSLLERLRSRQQNSFANRLLSLMRNKFGGHSATPR